MREIEVHDIVEKHGDVGSVGKNRANGLGNVRRGKSTGRHLVKQRLKQMMVGAVNDRDARVGMAEMLAKSQPAETSADHDHMNCLLSGTGTMSMNPGKNQWNELPRRTVQAVG